jgi:hypothetical protein
MLHPELFKQLESFRWNMEGDIPWDSFDPARLTDEPVTTIKMNAITEWSALPATEMFPRVTIQSRLPDPEWLEHWLDTQINFDSVWELNKYRRELSREGPGSLEAAALPGSV